MSIRRLLTSLALLPLAAAPARSQSAAPTDTARYVVLFSDRPAGYLKQWTSGGEQHTEYEFNDRGRGPHLVERVRVNERGLPIALEIAGHNYWKDSVIERFSMEGDAARWMNRVEGPTGAGGFAVAPRAAGRFYVTIDGTPSEGARLLRALQAAPGQRLPLIPAGEARLERVGERTVQTKGGPRTAVHYMVSGLGFSPWSVWLDRDGNHFASVSSWSSIIPEGWEQAVPELIKAQDAAEGARFERLARELAHRPAGPLVIRNARLFVAESATVRPRTTVVIVGNRIEHVGPDGQMKLPAGAQVIDAKGKTLLPGLWDMHVHIAPGHEPLLHVAAGVTSARDMGNDTIGTLDLRRQFASGTLIGPRLTLAGLIDSPGEFQVPIGVLASTEAEALTQVDRFAARGYEQIKLYSSLKPELVPAIVRHAHAKGLRVSGHVPAYMTAEQVVQLGFDEVQHANMLMLNFMDSVKDTRSMERFTAVAAHAAELDFSSPRVRDFIQLFADRHVVIDPTLVAFENMFLGRPGQVNPSAVAIVDRMPPQVRRAFIGGEIPVPDGMDQRYGDSYAAMLRMVKAMYDAGVQVVAGTDNMPGFMLHRELELYVQAGIPAPQVLRIATLDAARVMKHDDERGSIAPGKLADLVLVNGDPTTNISDIRKTELVVMNGVMYRPSEIYTALGIKP
jgi:imidazolonepropionase-like amidohydrolase